MVMSTSCPWEVQPSLQLPITESVPASDPEQKLRQPFQLQIRRNKLNQLKTSLSQGFLLILSRVQRGYIYAHVTKSVKDFCFQSSLLNSITYVFTGRYMQNFKVNCQLSLRHATVQLEQYINSGLLNILQHKRLELLEALSCPEVVV